MANNRVRKALFMAVVLIDGGLDPASALIYVRDNFALPDDELMQVQDLLPDEVTK